MSIYERDYMRGRRGGNAAADFFANISAVRLLILANIAVFVLEAVVDRLYGAGGFLMLFDLSWDGLVRGKVWTLLTYAFLHGNLWHIAFNMIALYFMGTPLEARLGWRRFLAVYFCGALGGALVWLGVSFGDGGGLVGASAAVMAVFACFCAFYPPVPITFLLFFVLPISAKPMTMLKVAAAIEVFGLLSTFAGYPSDIAYAAHLGGIAAGLLCARAIIRGRFDFLDSISFKAFARKSERYTKRASDYNFRVNISDPDALQKEVDRILDKIGERGFASLTDAERQTLAEARRRIDPNKP